MNDTHQEFFNMAYKGLEAQGWEKSSTPRDICLYRGPKGLKCAVGHCIPDELYKPYFDNGKTSLTAVMSDIGFGEEYWLFLNDMQRCHDNSRNAEQMKAELIDFAYKNNLEVPS